LNRWIKFSVNKNEDSAGCFGEKSVAGIANSLAVMKQDVIIGLLLEKNAALIEKIIRDD
jgi:hypothetical protein